MTARKTARKRPAAQGARKRSTTNHDIYFVPGLRRGLLVLETLATEGRPMSVAEIGKRIGLIALLDVPPRLYAGAHGLRRGSPGLEATCASARGC